MYDSAYPDHTASGDVYITVIRNPNAPVFSQDPYRRQISHTHPAGTISSASTFVYRVPYTVRVL